MKPKIGIADDHPVYANSIKKIIDNSDYTTAFITCHGDEILPNIEASPIDLLLLDVHMPGENTLNVLEKLKQTFPEVKVLLLTSEENEILIMDYLSKGAAGYLAKKADEVEILTAIKKVLNNEYHIPPHLVDFYIKSNLKHSFGDNMQIPINLSAVEKKIIEYTFCDCNAKEISEKLKLSKRTVDTYRQRLIQKTGAKSMFGVVRYALRHNLIEVK